MSFLELKGRLVTEASCLRGNAKESCGVCNTNKGYLLLVSRIVSSVARPDLHFGGEAARVAVCHFLCFGLRASLSVAAVIGLPWNSPCAALKAAVLELSLHCLGAQESCSILCFGCNFCCFSGSSAGGIFLWSCCTAFGLEQQKEAPRGTRS